MSESKTRPLEQSFLVLSEGRHHAKITFSKISTRPGWKFKDCQISGLIDGGWTLENWRSLATVGNEIDRLLDELNDETKG